MILRTRFGELPGVVGIESFLQIEGVRGRIGIGGTDHNGVLPGGIRGDPAHGGEIPIEFQQRGGFRFSRHSKSKQMGFAIAELLREVRASRGLGHFERRDVLAIEHDLHRGIAGGEQHGLEQLAVLFHWMAESRAGFGCRQPLRHRRAVGELGEGAG